MSTYSVAQTVTITKTGPGGFALVTGSEPINLVVNGRRVFITENYASGGTTFFETSYDLNGGRLTSGKYEIPGGVFKNAFTIEQVIALGDKQYAMIENMNAETGKYNFIAREITKGVVSSTETVLISYPFEKLLNSGGASVAVSPDKKKMASLTYYPGIKDVADKINITVYDENLVKLKEADMTYPGETKRSNFTLVVGNDGTVYLIKNTMSKIGEIILTVYQWQQNDNTFKEYLIVLPEPLYITSFTYALNANSEIILSGVYYKRATVTAGEQTMSGVFYYTNKGKTEDVFKTFPLDAPVENLVTRKVLVTESTVFLVAEQYKSVEDPLPAGATTRTYINTVTHKSNFVIGIGLDGTKKFQLELAKDFTSKNADHHNFSASFICNNKLTVVYNDDYRKYNPNGSGGQIPVLVQITGDGLMQAPIVFKDELALGATLYPCYAVQDADNQLCFLMGNGSTSQLLTVKIAD